MEAGSKLPIPAAKELGKSAMLLRKVQSKVNGMLGIFQFFINGDWTYINNHIYPVISRLSDEEKEEFNCDVLKIDWPSYLQHYTRGI